MALGLHPDKPKIGPRSTQISVITIQHMHTGTLFQTANRKSSADNPAANDDDISGAVHDEIERMDMGKLD